MNDAAKLSTTDLAASFLLAGKAILTLVSLASGARFTYKVTEKKGRNGSPLYFVGLLTGPSNDHDYTFLGTIFSDGRFVHGRRSAIGKDAPSAKAFSWFYRFVDAGRPLPSTLEVWHEGRCGRCGRRLTVPESIETGLGPVCAEKAAA